MLTDAELKRVVAGREVLIVLSVKEPQPERTKRFFGGCAACKGDVWIRPESAVLLIERDVVPVCSECLGIT